MGDSVLDFLPDAFGWMTRGALESASTYAAHIDGVWNLIFWFTAFWGGACLVLFFYFIFRFRKKEGVKAQYITGEEEHEKKWISIPHALVLVCDVFIIIFAVQVWHSVKQVKPETDTAGRPPIELNIMSQQWAWTFTHPGADKQFGTADDIQETDELHIEVGRLYHYNLESRDVMHDFSVPVFRLKQDSIPGRVISGWFESTKTGEYDIQCAEMCGLGHGIMGARIFIQSPEQHAKWIESKSNTSIAAAAAVK